MSVWIEQDATKVECVVGPAGLQQERLHIAFACELDDVLAAPMGSEHAGY